jgi:hypothetical protein
MLAIYLLNIGGQLAAYQFMVYKSDKFYNAQTKVGRYNVNDLTEIRIPAEMPGISDWAGYENVSGQVKFAYESYNYVKMKVTRHAIYLMCVPNYETTNLSTQNIIHAENIKDIPVPKKQHVPYGKIVLSAKFDTAINRFAFISSAKILPVITIQPVQSVVCYPLAIPEQPPRLFC